MEDRRHAICFLAWIQVAAKSPSLGLRYNELPIRAIWFTHSALVFVWEDILNLVNAFDLHLCILHILQVKRALPPDVLAKYEQRQAEDAVVQAKITGLVSLISRDISIFLSVC